MTHNNEGMAETADGDGTGCDNETAMIVVLAGVPAKENWTETTAM